MPEPLSELIPRLLARLEKEIKETRDRMEEGWRQSIDNELWEWSRPLWMSDGELLVEVDSSTIIDVLRYKSPEIIKKLNQNLEDTEVSSIRFRLGG